MKKPLKLINVRPFEIPDFSSFQEEADFWDTHSIAGYINEFEEVKLVYEPETEKKETMTIRVTPSLKKLLNNMAKKYNVNPSTLVRMWVIDRVREETAEYRTDNHKSY
ncbi:hypothetical protein A3F07_04430 [candidate division WWE3 bacterium RIFCSPHIGHO2_12_FULL_38_15]|uniref:CopG antitoxin of type II toxin-antitoxin system n=1 Tax=candidate division WWE3 bacterium RIFCSPHIGHO2_02_FULL_38_14 TaxID=1802620 RepID=A0A1F4V700_UNCKA|nr:MAG: hypothetical protein A2793_01220 [candidate division WWE3 bacterium RIFCSPHIGHO2_01_FULL_38_45]OGC48998.1 MAG: hypothetical protein A3F07_04430 [candidate division WWE3 bacterium RIFCSPHIGHO2_12_FULL_38_15]OGC52896.1 MAG: hypothetical protein A3D91_03440 [candidate division WWE3 bacterium RIFCSPHIGHO2_02_FULL_38_14]OGC54609.1 MAG: hypothetical protein A3B64_03045 [candidate division WWE3 bacterium RIFCSPLOWO2_01_FULL_37_24]HLB51350.1 CopG family antitoxin [Patescibacteria group bacteriu